MLYLGARFDNCRSACYYFIKCTDSLPRYVSSSSGCAPAEKHRGPSSIINSIPKYLYRPALMSVRSAGCSRLRPHFGRAPASALPGMPEARSVKGSLHQGEGLCFCRMNVSPSRRTRPRRSRLCTPLYPLRPCTQSPRPLPADAPHNPSSLSRSCPGSPRIS